MELHDPLLPNPTLTANWFSKDFSFWWLNDFFRKGSKRTLQTSDMYEVTPDDESKRLTSRLQSLWQKEKKAAVEERRKPRLWHTVRAFLGFRIWAIGVFYFVEDFSRIAQPVLIGKFLTYFSPEPGITHLEVYMYALGLIIATLVPAAVHHPAFFRATRLGMQLRVAVSGLVYQKAVHLSHGSLGRITTGHIINVLTSDIQKLEQVTFFMNYLWLTPLLVVVAAYLIWQELGPSCIPGIAILLLLGPFQIFLGRYFSRLRQKTAALSDERIGLMNEIISGMRVIKMYTWEESFAKLVAKVRSRESNVIKRNAYLRSLNASFSLVLMPLICLFVFTTYVMTGNSITPKKVFVVVGVFHTIRGAMTIFFPYAIRNLKEGFVSEKRIQGLLEMEEKEQSKSFRKISVVPKTEIPKVKVANATASWDGNLTTLEDVNFEVNPGQLLIVVGPVGCGKSSLLMALLGEMPLSKGDVQVKGRIGYASQQPWIFSGTVKENITFGQDFDEDRYKEVVKVCALQKDIKLFPKGDLTLVGERGVALSGGQKARINLARAAYYDLATVFLLDDPLSAVDMHVGKQLFDECICGLMRDRIVILVTHQLQYLKRATSILCLNDGRCVGHGTYEELAERGLDVKSLISTTDVEGDGGLDPHIDKMRETDQKQNLSIDVQKRSRALSSVSLATTEACDVPDVEPLKPDNEDRTVGKVTWRIYVKYVRYGGTPLVLVILLILMLGSQGLVMTAEWWLAFWADAEEREAYERTQSVNVTDTTALLSRNTYMSVYSSVLLAGFITTIAATGLFFHTAVSASQALHDVMFRRVLRAPIYFFDTNPVGRVLNRFSKDIFQMDDLLVDAAGDFSRLAILAFAILLLNVVSIPYLLIVVIPVVSLFLWIRSYYLKTSREVKRLEAMSRSPFYSHLSASINGLLSIRAFKAEDRFVEMYNYYQNFHTSAWFIFLSTSRWLAFRLDFLCFIFISMVVLASLIIAEAGVPISAGLVGLCLTYAKMLTGMFQWCVRQSAEVENLMTSVERVMEYSNLEQEADLYNDDDDDLPEDWPAHGVITADRMHYAHHRTLPLVLSNINFTIKANEKVGVVGRTGAGKSSLMAALFRFAEPEGLIEIDGVTITDIGLHGLRSKISTIPQDPVLFSGTLRKNLDPFNEHEDHELWNVLEEVQLKEAVEELPDGLQTQLAEAGSNFSVGQRQLVCLARAILRHNKILVIDEATANVDHSTDSLIQETIRLKFKDCTVLTIAHRLNTIMDSDRVMVLDEGRLVEFDEPYILLQNKDSLFTQLVEQTNQSTAAGLYEVARQAYELRHDQSINDESEKHEKADGNLDEDFGTVDKRPRVTFTAPGEEDEASNSSRDSQGKDMVPNACETDQLIGNDDDSGAVDSLPLVSFTAPKEEDAESSNSSGDPDACETDQLIGNDDDSGAVDSLPQIVFTKKQDAPTNSPGDCEGNELSDACETDQLIDKTSV